jgi:membrane-associated protein
MAFGICLLAVLGGDTIAFFFGRRYGRRVLASNLARRYFTPKRQLRTRAYFRKFGSKVVLVGRFTPGLRFTIFFTAGTLHVRAATFFIYDFVAAAFSVPVLVYVAYFFGEQIDNVIKYARRTEHGILVAILIAAAIVTIKLLRRRKRIQRMAAVAE